MRDLYGQNYNITSRRKPHLISAPYIRPEFLDITQQENRIVVRLKSSVMPQIPLIPRDQFHPETVSQESNESNNLFDRAEVFFKRYPVLTFTACFAMLHMIEKFLEMATRGSQGVLQISAVAGVSFLSALKFFINKQPINRK